MRTDTAAPCRRCAALVFAMLLGGCAALQIDVDVYKGPLVNNEQIQQQQVISMALSAEVLIIAARNQFIERALNRQQDSAKSTSSDLYLDGRQHFSDSVCPAATDAGDTKQLCHPRMEVDPGTKTTCKRLEARQAYEEAKLCHATQFGTGFIANIDLGSDSDSKKKRKYLRMAAQLNRLLTFYTKPPSKSKLACGCMDEQSAPEPDDSDGIRSLAKTVVSANELEQDLDVPSNDERAVAAHAQTRKKAVLSGIKLERKLADFASQMQFLAINQWLVEDEGKPRDEDEKAADRNKALFEAIANTILLHIDDIQNRRKFDKHAIASGAAERKSLENALAGNLAAPNLEPPREPGPKNEVAADTNKQPPGAEQTHDKTSQNVASSGRTGTSPADVNARSKQAGISLDKSSAADEGMHALHMPDAPADPDRHPDTVSGKSIDVMDAVIAELRYFHLRTLKEKGKNDQQTINAAEALVEARKQRALMIYLRPSSAYLRSVFATTYTQQDPGLTWQNLLNDRFKDMLTEIPVVRRLPVVKDFKVEEPKVREVRADLDKVYWQNINTVRVSGAGSTNFVVAKDDVGNWYVKAMGADPEAMIKAATNTALFSYSGKLDTNLLRIAQLRDRIDATSSDVTATQRADAIKELAAYKVGISGPAAAAHDNTWALFEDNYRKQATVQLTAMLGLLNKSALVVELRRRWDNTLSTVALASERKTITDLLDRLAVTDANTRAKDALQDSSAKDNPSGAVVTALEALRGSQDSLRADVLSEKTLTAKAAADLTIAATARATAEQMLELSLATLTSAEANLIAAEAAAKAGDVQADVPAAKNAYDGARKNVARDGKALAAARIAVASATDAYDAAVGRRNALLSDLDLVYGQYIRNEGSRRMTANDEMETAARIVGKSVSGQTE